MYKNRLLKELKQLQSSPIQGITIKDVSDLKKWIVVVHGAKGTLYENETFYLQFRFSDTYPIDSPEVIFIGKAPVNPHIYSNGHICLSILYNDWSPALTVSSICLSILSMLSSATEKVRPEGNDEYVRSCMGRSPKLTRWIFHDDKV